MPIVQLSVSSVVAEQYIIFLEIVKLLLPIFIGSRKLHLMFTLNNKNYHLGCTPFLKAEHVQ